LVSRRLSHHRQDRKPNEDHLAHRLTHMRKRIAVLRTRAERSLLWRVWERMLEIEFIDRSVAIAGKVFVSFFPLVVVVAAFAPEGIRSSILTSVTARLGLRGDALTLAREAFASADDIRKATGLLGLVLTIFFATSFTTALQRVYLRAWRRPPRAAGVGAYWRGAAWLLVALVCLALLGGLRGALGGGLGFGLFAIVALVVTAGLWWFTAWFLLLGEVRTRVLIPTGVITSVATAGYAASATIWMPGVVTSNEAQFGFFGVALALVTWFSGAAICVLIGACAGPVLAEDAGFVGRLIRGGESGTLTAGARPSLPAPARELSLRDAFHSTEDS
jgi:membrane protein